MHTAPLSLDGAVWGFLRHRFVRAMVAAALMFTALNVLVGSFVLIYELFASIDYGWLFERGLWTADGRAWLGELLGRAFSRLGGALTEAAVIAAVVTPIFLVLMFIVDAMPPRITGFIISLACAVGVFFGVLFVATLMQDALRRSAGIVAAGQVLVPAFVFLFGIEVMAWASWQFTTRSRVFYAARGWRPSLWPIMPALRWRLGLPGFISNYGKGRNTLTAIYSLLALLNIGLLAPIFVPFLLSEIGNAQGWLTRIVAGIYIAFLLLNFVGLRPLLNRWARRRAAQLYQDAREWDGRAPVVFLRPFDQDATRLPARGWDPLVKLASGDAESRTLDELLLEHGSIYGPVLAIGEPGNPTPPLGAARIFVQGPATEWQTIVSSLVEASKVVVICPSTSYGIQWEVDLIARLQAQIKVALLANPSLSAAENLAFLERFAPEAAAKLSSSQALVAAYNAGGEWRVVTSSKPPSVQTYTMGLNLALQALLGRGATPLVAPQQATHAAAA